ncbi:cytochrome C biogenesis protein [Rhizobium chutanense]|uniref:Cytochrome C biogenesis protein n=1 Tax=Rhizobium chutanense TaxID=2035448 RepID=A0A2A6J2C2_9HYPH|nr:type II secretion system F family protein [Rhizobium chutanense]PDT00064.1 cytochrome C biogenesis protein [Rhizobium chutanense]
MAKFEYSLFAADGRKRTGTVEATDLPDARRKLRSPGITVSDVRPFGTVRSRALRMPKIGQRFDHVRFIGNLAVLVTAGLTLDQSLRALRASASNQIERDRLDAMLERLSAGAAASSTFALIDGLPDDILALIASGEKTARLADVLSVIASDLERRKAHRKQLLDALLYPAFLLLMMLLAVGVVTFVLVPALEPIFQSSDRETPFLIAFLSMAGQLLSDPLFALVGGASFLLAVVTYALKAQAFSRWGTAILIKMPVFGPLIIKIALARYLQTLSLLLDNAVAMPEALALAAKACTVSIYRPRLSAMREAVISGRRLAEAFSESRLFPESIVSLTAVGDEVNKLAAVLANGSNIMRVEAQRTLDRLLSLLTPTITILLGLLVGGLVISVMTALLSVNELGAQ